MTAKLKPCPFCGNSPYIEKIPLWNSSYGYYGCFKFDIHCDKCGCRIDLGQNDTVYCEEKQAIKNAVTAWNRRTKE